MTPREALDASVIVTVPVTGTGSDSPEESSAELRARVTGLFEAGPGEVRVQFARRIGRDKGWSLWSIVVPEDLQLHVVGRYGS